MPKNISSGTAHRLTPAFKTALLADKAALTAWESLTPLARNEWLCWITFPKKAKTRQEHMQRALEELKDGIRRPCCWIGCIHRKDKEMSKSVKWVLNKSSSKSKT